MPGGMDPDGLFLKCQNKQCPCTWIKPVAGGEKVTFVPKTQKSCRTVTVFVFSPTGNFFQNKLICDGPIGLRQLTALCECTNWVAVTNCEKWCRKDGDVVFVEKKQKKIDLPKTIKTTGRVVRTKGGGFKCSCKDPVKPLGNASPCVFLPEETVDCDSL